MISSVDGATAASTPTHANGSRWSCTRSAPAGIAPRETPWKPSPPAMNRHSSRSLAARRPVAQLGGACRRAGSRPRPRTRARRRAPARAGSGPRPAPAARTRPCVGRHRGSVYGTGGDGPRSAARRRGGSGPARAAAPPARARRAARPSRCSSNPRAPASRRRRGSSARAPRARCPRRRAGAPAPDRRPGADDPDARARHHLDDIATIASSGASRRPIGFAMGKTKGTVVLSAVKLLRSQTEAAPRLLPCRSTTTSTSASWSPPGIRRSTCTS